MQIIVTFLILDHIFFTSNLLLPEKCRDLPSELQTCRFICCRGTFGQIRTSAPVTAGKIINLHKSTVLFPQIPMVQINIERPVIFAFKFRKLCSDFNFLLLGIVQNPEHYVVISGEIENITHHHLNLAKDFFRQSPECVLNFIEFVFVEVQTFKTFLFRKKRFKNLS